MSHGNTRSVARSMGGREARRGQAHRSSELCLGRDGGAFNRESCVIVGVPRGRRRRRGRGQSRATTSPQQRSQSLARSLVRPPAQKRMSPETGPLGKPQTGQNTRRLPAWCMRSPFGGQNETAAAHLQLGPRSRLAAPRRPSCYLQRLLRSGVFSGLAAWPGCWFMPWNQRKQLISLA